MKIVLTALCGDYFPKQKKKVLKNKSNFTTFISYFSPQSFLMHFCLLLILVSEFLKKKTNYKKK